MNFMSRYHLYFLVSLAVIISGLVSMLSFGFKPSIDFTGGSLLEVKTTATEITPEKVTDQAKNLYEVSSVQASGPQQFMLRGKTITNDKKNEVIAALNTAFPTVSELRFETVGPTLGRELLLKTLTAAAVVATLITIYVAYQFSDLKYGICAIIAMIHDSLVLLGVFSLLGHFYGVEVDVLFVTALMTTLSFSIHDTIVVYDRIREVRRLQPRLSFKDIVDLAVLQTLGRSINNSMTIIIMLLSLVLLGGESIRWFAVALLVGAVTGTYSSTFTAAPLLLLWEDVKKRTKTA
ncbi:MAG TPA: protein translocase subunit SecF [Vitreimonas sp.]|nr:protein translocase subunit SecF [Vitreimonas sp.]